MKKASPEQDARGNEVERTGVVGRPRRVFDLGQVENLGRFGCTLEEVAVWLKTSRSVVHDRMANDEDFRAAYQTGLNSCRISLRRQQLHVAMAGGVGYEIDPATGQPKLDPRTGRPLEVVVPPGGIDKDGKRVQPLQGQVACLIWLGKQLLGQRERIEEVPADPAAEKAARPQTYEEAVEFMRARTPDRR